MIFASNPFLNSYSNSDLFGKFIFLTLFTLSIISWVILINKIKLTKSTQKRARVLKKQFAEHRELPLSLNFNNLKNPFAFLYQTLKRSAGEILSKHESAVLSSADIDLIDSAMEAEVANQTKELERHLFLLPTIVSLAPFLGLLGTVWGILLTLGELEVNAASMSLAGLSMALATTVLGLLVAIPPLIGYNYLKSLQRDFAVEMHTFSQMTLAAVEIQYRR